MRQPCFDVGRIQLAFQLTHSRGVRRKFCGRFFSILLFQLTHSRGVRLIAMRPVSFNLEFQLTHSRGVRRLSKCFHLKIQNFNSRTHVECDVCIFCTSFLIQISTHALTWSATLQHSILFVTEQISTHALTWSATTHTTHA